MIYDTECTKKACEEETIRNNPLSGNSIDYFKNLESIILVPDQRRNAHGSGVI